MTEGVTIQLITTAGVVLVGFMQLFTNRRLKVVGKDAAEAREQTKNTHETNLRHDLDEVKDKVTGLDDAVTKASDAAERASDAACSAARTVIRVENYVRDVDASVRGVQHSLERNVGLLRQRVQDTEQGITATVRAALSEHVQTHHKENRK